MALFFVLACLLVAVALITILPSALTSRNVNKNSDQQELNQLDTNIRIAKERRASLNDALANGVIDEATFASEVSDLENALAIDLSAKQQAQESNRSGIIIASLIALFLPIASGALYLKLGTPNGIDTSAMHEQALADQQQQQQQQTQANKPPALAELLPNLEKKLEANPDDVNGWKLLGKSYLTIGEFANAKRALLKAYELDPKDPDLLAQLAEATAMETNGDLSGQPSDYLDAALTIDPAHQPSLWLKAIASQQAGEHEDAIQRLESLRINVAGNAAALASIDEMTTKSKQALGLVTEDLNANATTDSNANAINNNASQSDEANDSNTANDASNTNNANEGSSIKVTVNLAGNVKENVSPSDAVFIFARASSGPPMPLAAARYAVSDLPISVVLDDSMAMIPNMTLSQFPTVTVGARISKSGNAIAQDGDWFTEQTEVNVNATDALTLTIDQQK